MKRPAIDALCQELQDHRVITAEDLRIAGADDSAIYRARGGGLLQDLPGIDGIYVVGKEPYGDDVLMHAAARWAGPGAVITGIWAARLLKLPWVPVGGTCLVRIDEAHKRRGSEGFVTVCRTKSMERLQTWEHDGLLIAAAPQAVVDASRQLQTDKQTRHALPTRQLRDVRGLVLGAVAKKRCTTDELDVVVGQGSVRHTAHIRRALTDASRGAASPPEAELVDGLLPYGVPFYCNVEVWVGGVLLGIADVYLVGTGVGGELDSKQEHSAKKKLDATLVRDDVFKDARIDLRHITPSRYRADPERYHRTLIRTAKRRLEQGLGDPPGLELRPLTPLLCGPPSSDVPYRLPSSRPAAA
ncbi:MAG: hypothetical protein QOG99_2323 [Frankiales bacterium]|jgi:hypothetical protein|nr:hypothetical protein [Frankiales bacterium]